MADALGWEKANIHECKECFDILPARKIKHGLCPKYRKKVLTTTNPDVLRNSKMTGSRSIVDELISAKLPTQIEPQTQGE